MKLPLEKVMEKYKDNIFAASFNLCGSRADADDIVQETFLQYYLTDKEFESEQHIRAWLLRVALNKSKNILTSSARSRNAPLDEYIDTLAFDSPESGSLFEEVMKLPEKYRVVIHLYYYEDYSVDEIAGILRLTKGNVKMRLSRGRKILKDNLQEEWNNDRS